MYEINPFNVNDTHCAVHGGNVVAFARAQGCQVSEVIDFSANINPLGLSPLALAAISNNLAQILNYPDRFCGRLREQVAQKQGLKVDQVLIGNGSTELIHLIPRALGLKKVLLPVPSFSEYEKAVVLSGAEPVFMALPADHDFSIDVDALVAKINGAQAEKIDAIFLCNPNNPTGHLLSKKDLGRILKAAYHLGVLVILDEAFIDFVPDASIIAECQWYINLIVLRSFTKFYALPGLRIGYLAANATLVSQIERIQVPWSVNHLAVVAAAAAMTDGDYIAESLRLVETEKVYLNDALSALPGVVVFPSSANFVLMKLPETGPDADFVSKSLGPDKMLVRSCESFRGLDESYLRIAIKTHAQNKQLIAKLRDLLGEN